MLTKNTYLKGRINEGRVAAELKRKGWKNVRKSKGSRGPADIYARTPNGTKAYIQVKSGSAKITKKEVKKLKKLAKKRRGVAVVIYKRSKKNPWKFLGNWSR